MIQAVAFQVLMNTILVFTKARTATLLGNEWLDLSTDFVERLNRCLDLLPKSVHGKGRLQIVPRKIQVFFIVYDDNRRFNWSRTLSHQDVGRNLDFCGQGHIYGEGVKRRFTVTVYAFEGAAQHHITIEGVFLDDVSDISPINSFFDKRTSLYNHTMVQLGLPYKFGHFWRDWHDQQQLQRVMSSPTPPTHEWWAANYPFVNQMQFRMSFVSELTLFEQHWSTLTAVYRHLSANPPKLFNECSEELDHLFQEMNTYFRSPVIDYPSATSSTDDQTKLFARFTTFDFVPVDCQDDLTCIVRSGAKRFIGALLESLRTHTLERQKLRPPLVHMMDLGGKWESYGHERFSKDPLRLSIKEILTKAFWFDETY